MLGECNTLPGCIVLLYRLYSVHPGQPHLASTSWFYVMQIGSGGVADLCGDVVTEDWVISEGIHVKGRERAMQDEGAMWTLSVMPQKIEKKWLHVFVLRKMMDWQTKELQFPLGVRSPGMFSSYWGRHPMYSHFRAYTKSSALWVTKSRRLWAWKYIFPP